MRRYGAGPGAVRFISGTWARARRARARLAAFHGREAAMLFSSAYATVMGVLPPLITDKTAVISDALNHNCIINAIALARPAEKHIYPHLDLGELERALERRRQDVPRAPIVVTDGVFSMRGDHAPLDRIMELAARLRPRTLPRTSSSWSTTRTASAPSARPAAAPRSSRAPGRSMCWSARSARRSASTAATWSPASRSSRYLRETSPFYIYSNPITPGEAQAALAAVDRVDSEAGPRAARPPARHDRALPRRACRSSGSRRSPGEHPVVPLMVRDTARTGARSSRICAANGILATGLSYPGGAEGRRGDPLPDLADHTRRRHRRGARRARAVPRLRRQSVGWVERAERSDREAHRGPCPVPGGDAVRGTSSRARSGRAAPRWVRRPSAGE